MPEPEAVQSRDAAAGEAGAVARGVEFADDELMRDVYDLIAQHARTRGAAAGARLAMLLMSTSLRWVLDVGGPDAARLYWRDIQQALEETILFRTAQPQGRHQ